MIECVSDINKEHKRLEVDRELWAPRTEQMILATRDVKITGVGYLWTEYPPDSIQQALNHG